MHTTVSNTNPPQDALNKEYSLKPSQERAAGILKEGHQALQLHTSHSHGEISLGYIEGVAKVRFALSVVAEQFHKHATMKPALLHAVRTVCTDLTVNHMDDTDSTGPVLYFLKLIVRQIGFPCLTEVSEEHPWVVPRELKKADQVTVLTRWESYMYIISQISYKSIDIV